MLIFCYTKEEIKLPTADVSLLWVLILNTASKKIKLANQE